MICQHCHEQPAQLQYTEVVSGTKKVEWLCTRCAESRGISIHLEQAPSPHPSPTVPSVRVREADAHLACPECGLGVELFRESGRVGCPRCYDVFRELLDSLLRRVHHATEHSPQEGGQDAHGRLRRVLGTLRRQLSESVRLEEFERAASLRDEIRAYEEELHSLPEPEESA